MQTFDSLRSEVLAVFPELLGAARQRGASSSVARLTAARTRLLDGRLNVVVCGEFKRGKSQLLNALLEEPGLFPVDAYVATSLVTTVSYGSQETVVVSLDDGRGGVERREISRGEIAEYATESANPDNAKRAKLVEITLPSGKLASGLTLVDTPGVGAVHREHTAATFAFLPNADVILFVADVTQPLTDSELGFLAQAAESVHALEDMEALLCVLAKIDMVADYRSMLANTTTKLAEVTGRPVEEVSVVPVSSQARLDYLVSGDPEDAELSNFAALEERLWSTLERRRARVLLGGALRDLESATVALLEPLNAQIRALRDDARAQLAETRQQADARAARLRELDEGHAAWRRDLAKDLNTVGQELKVAARDGLREVWQRFHGVYLYDSVYLANPPMLFGQVAADVAQLVGTLNRRAADRAALVQRTAAVQCGLDLHSAAVGTLPDPPVPDWVPGGPPGPQGAGYMHKMQGTSIGGVAGASAGGTIGTALGAVVGSVLPGAGTVAGFYFGGWIGTALGTLIGGMVGYRGSAAEVAAQQVEARRDSLRSAVGGLPEQQQRHLEAAVDELVADLIVAVTAELESRIAQERESVRDTISRLDAAAQVTTNEIDERLSALGREQAPLANIRQQIITLAMAVHGLAPSSEEGSEEKAVQMAGST